MNQELTGGMQVMLRSAELGGYITAMNPAETAACKKLLRAKLVTHVRASVYKLTDEGRRVRDDL